MDNKLRSVKILEEVLGYFLHHGVEKLDISFFSDDKKLIITVRGSTDVEPQDLPQLIRLLNEPRKPEYEEYYWSLLGASSKRQELHLLGSLVDCGAGSFKDHTLTIHVERDY
ncbi:MAG TPA: hypothetical protein DEF30_02825 [Proteiniclasticum sp.]|uniref:hypothetical protein n=1 Tax=Proteiniclasticum sp. TaxID=2053595 RepID=UPI000E9E7BE9|nr:hypothetical protein [Proteiniclasticum sp.]HBW12746.1 hypothetical protein [Proteiniclasticum sp.]